MDWLPSTNRFHFRLNAGAKFVAPYAVGDSLLPANSFLKRRLGVFQSVPNCTTSPRPTAFMRTLVDNVFVNTAAFIAAAPEGEASAPIGGALAVEPGVDDEAEFESK
jgi:hypothetical protein